MVCKLGSSIFLIKWKDREVSREFEGLYPVIHQGNIPTSVPRVLYKFPVFVHFRLESLWCLPGTPYLDDMTALIFIFPT